MQQIYFGCITLLLAYLESTSYMIRQVESGMWLLHGSMEMLASRDAFECHSSSQPRRKYIHSSLTGSKRSSHSSLLFQYISVLSSGAIVLAAMVAQILNLLVYVFHAHAASALGVPASCRLPPCMWSKAVLDLAAYSRAMWSLTSALSLLTSMEKFPWCQHLLLRKTYIPLDLFRSSEWQHWMVQSTFQ